MPKTQTLEQTKLSEPKMYKVILLNDDVTTMDFVIEILMNIFHQNLEKASQTMLEIHHYGRKQSDSCRWKPPIFHDVYIGRSYYQHDFRSTVHLYI